jgi:hypothetical protein
MMDFLTAHGHDVEVGVTPTRKEHGKLSVAMSTPVAQSDSASVF